MRSFAHLIFFLFIFISSSGNALDSNPNPEKTEELQRYLQELHRAIEAREAVDAEQISETFHRLLNENASPHITSYKYTPLGLLNVAAHIGDVALIDFLIVRGVRINDNYCVNGNDYTSCALSSAILNKQEAAVLRLIEAGSTTKFLKQFERRYRGLLPPFQFSLAPYDKEETRVLKQYLTEILALKPQTISEDQARDYSLKIKEVVSRGADPNVELYFYSALHFAAQNGDLGLVNFLVLRGANISTRVGYYQETPLMWAAKSGNAQTVIKLISFGADIYERTNANQCTTALDLASGEARELLVSYSEENLPNEKEHWLYRAIRTGFLDPLKHICEHEALLPTFLPLINQVDAQGQTLFDIALVTRNEEALTLLLNHNIEHWKGLFRARLASRIPLLHLIPSGRDIYKKIYNSEFNFYISIINENPIFVLLPEGIKIFIAIFIIDSPPPR